MATTGAFTIPLMKKIGYQPTFAGAVEAAASTGGQIMPPIMGSAAFIMAEYLGIPYLVIAVAAIIPALLYFASVYFQVDLRARSLGLKGIDKADMPNVGKTVLRYGQMIIPMIVLIWLMGEGRTPLYSAFFAVCLTVSSPGSARRRGSASRKRSTSPSTPPARACRSASRWPRRAS